MSKPNKKFSLLRRILSTLGLSENAVDEIVEFIINLLSEKELKNNKNIEYPYILRDDFITPAEHNFYLVLHQIVSDFAIICPKVSLGDLFFAQTGNFSKNRSYKNRIDRKHVDFLVCNPKTLCPIFGIELDDKSHKRSDRQERDFFVNKVFDAAKLPLVHIPVKRAYQKTEIRSHIEKIIKLEDLIKDNIINSEEFEEALQIPTCPNCKKEMILRKANTGNNKGQEFWGCSDFPKCRGTRPKEINVSAQEQKK